MITGPMVGFIDAIGGTAYVVIGLTNFDPPTAGNAVRRMVSWLPE